MQARDEWWVTELEALKHEIESFAYRRLGNASLAEDVVQDATLSIVEALRSKKQAYPSEWFGLQQPAADAIEQFRGFAWRVVRRRLHDMLRRRYREMAKLGRQSATPLDEFPEATDLEPDKKLDALRFLNLLLAHVEALPAPDRDVLAEALAPEETLSPAARKRLSRVREKLAKIMAESLSKAERGRT